VLALALAALVAAAPPAAPASFHLRSGDRVVFYGDSITDQRLYTTFIETYVLTRFPHLDVRFIHSGWGGDRVTGGQGGQVDVRLQRDVFAHRPPVVTVMLGMNDGRYRPFEQPIYDRFVDGYERLIRTLRSELPQARLTVIQPSPYDDVTRPPFEGGSYNQVMLRFGAFIKQVAAREHLGFADFNGDLVAVLKKMNAEDSKVALKLIPDRVHPSEAGHLVMMQSLLKAWGAPALVTSVEIDGARGRLVAASNTQVSDLVRADGALRWTQLDRALPMPIDLTDPVIDMAAGASGFVQRLDPAALQGDRAGHRARTPCASTISRWASSAAPSWPRDQPGDAARRRCSKQANDVHELTLKHNDIHFTRWRLVQTRLEKDGAQQTGGALDALDKLEQEIIERQHVTARPRLRRFELVPVSPRGRQRAPRLHARVRHGELRQVLLDGNRRKDLEVYLELDGESESPATLVLRMTDRGRGYRVSLDGREGGSFGRVEPPVAVKDARPPARPPVWQEHWKKASGTRCACASKALAARSRSGSTASR
jgi:lysophospholipase L1-like esterase